MANEQWDLVLPAGFCEGKMIPYLVPGIYEFFSTVSGAFLIFIGVAGSVQPRLETLLKTMYAGIAVSGVGTVLLHYRRILIYNYSDVYPLIMTLAIGMIAFFDELVFEFRRPRMPDGLLMPWGLHKKNELVSVTRAFMDALVYNSSMAYLIIGLCLVIFEKEFSFDVVGIYFGVPYALTAIGGMFYLCQFRPDPIPENRLHLKRLRNWATAIGFTGIFFKIMDSFFCNHIDVWLMPHPFFHILTTYGTHCFIVFLAFYRANNILIEGDPQPEIKWAYRIYPYIVVPDVPDIEQRKASRGEPDEALKKLRAQSSMMADSPFTTAKKAAPEIRPESPEKRPEAVSVAVMPDKEPLS